jgi:hypothetical protein
VRGLKRIKGRSSPIAHGDLRHGITRVLGAPR